MVELIDKITFEDVDGTKHTYNIWDSDAARKISNFSMAERRQNIISGDGYNTIYSKLSKWYNDFAPVVWSGSYNDLIDRPTIPVVRDGQLDIQRNGVSVGVFSANASVSRTINILVPEINDNISSPTTLYSSWKIDQLIQQLGPNIITPPDPSSEIPQSTITQIEEYIINKIENGEVEIPSSEQQIDYNTINAYIDDSVGSAVKNGKLYITVNGQNVLKAHGGQLLPAIDSYYSANQAEDYDLDLIINDPSDVIDDTTTENGKTWSSQKIHNEIIASGSLRMVVTNERPLVGESNTIYFVKDTTGEENEYTEYAWVGDSWENIGKQVIDLSDYAHHNEIKDSTINIIQNGVVLGSFTLNQSSNLDITIPTPLIGDGTITITQGFDTETVVEGGETVTREVPHVVGTFTVNQGGNTTIDIPKPDEQIQSDWNQSNENAKDFIKNKPTIPEEQVNADWDSESGKSQILNKPTDLVHTSDIEGLLRNDGSVYTGKYLEQVDDLDNFQASEGKIVQYTGETNSKYTNGHTYKKTVVSTVIPAGTDYIRVNYSSNLKLEDVGIEKGIYYKTDKKDEITSNIRDFCLQRCYSIGAGGGDIPVSYENISTYPIYKVQRVYAFYTQNNQLYFNKIKAATYEIVNNVYIPYDVTFVDGTLVRSTYLAILGNVYSGVETGEPIPESKIIIFENILGQKIYCIKVPNNTYNLKYKMLVLNDMGDYYQVVNPDIGSYTGYADYFSNGTTTEERTIEGVTKWLPWDTQSRDDISHFVTDSDIGWIEH